MTALITPRKLRIASPKLIYGWEVTELLKSWCEYGKFHRDEFEILNYSTLTLSAIDGYVAHTNSDISVIKPPRAGDEPEAPSRFNSDAYLPPGTVATMFMVEYEAFDRYTEEWIWTPSTELLGYDSIWIKKEEQHLMRELADATTDKTPRAIRLRKVLRQVRMDDWSWSAPTVVPPPALFRWVDGELQEDGYSSMGDIPVWSIPNAKSRTGKGGTFGEASMFVVLANIHEMVRPMDSLQTTIGPPIEPIENRDPVIVLGRRIEATGPEWAGNENVRQLCSELLRMVYPVRYT